MSHAGKKVLSHGRDLIRPSERGLDRLDRQKGYVAQAERRHNPDKTKNNVNIRKNDRKEANLVMSLYCQFPLKRAGSVFTFCLHVLYNVQEKEPLTEVKQSGKEPAGRQKCL